MSVLDMDAGVIALAGKVDLVYGPLVDAQEFPESVDVTLVEGAVSSAEDLHQLQTIRQRSHLLVALGDCAVTSNVSCMRNTIPVSRLLQRVYVEGADEGKTIPTDGVPSLLKQARPLQEFVKVDLHLPGCPPPAKTILAVVNGLLGDGKAQPAATTMKFG
jgi:NAD-reducing hydrogenase small subunit